LPSTSVVSVCECHYNGIKVFTKPLFSSFLQQPAKSFFNGLFIGTGLGHFLQAITEAKAISKGLKTMNVRGAE
jgi:hypothetical protein